jgi:hypothetical protein
MSEGDERASPPADLDLTTGERQPDDEDKPGVITPIDRASRSRRRA